jgi:hypothetical protein
LKNNFNRLHYFDQVRPESGHLSAFPDESLEAGIVARLVYEAGLTGEQNPHTAQIVALFASAVNMGGLRRGAIVAHPNFASEYRPVFAESERKFFQFRYLGTMGGSIRPARRHSNE